MTAGSVDDGKSTLIGRLLYDSQSIYEDQLRAVKSASRGDLELALLTDGLRAEREQGITIDVAYRYFSTAKRKFILADTPGHVQYTRNMATGASNADLALLLVDASRGVQPQSKRHAHIIGLLGIRHLVVLINKMDLVHNSESVFLDLRDEMLSAIGRLDFESVRFFPVSANSGMNVVHRSPSTPWFRGPAVLEYLETVDILRPGHAEPFRLPVQLVQRTSDFRGYSGQLAGGEIAVGDRVTVLPSLRGTRIKSIVSFDGELDRAIAPQSVTITVEDELDISRGDTFASPESLPFSAQGFTAQMIWFSEHPLSSRKRYLLKHTTQTTTAEVSVQSVLDIDSLRSQPAGVLRINDLGIVHIETAKKILFDAYRNNRATGSFVLIDPGTNNTVAAGMIISPSEERRTESVNRPSVIVSLSPESDLASVLADRLETTSQSNVVVLSVWNKRAVELLSASGIHVVVLDAQANLHGIQSPATPEELFSLLDIP